MDKVGKKISARSCETKQEQKSHWKATVDPFWSSTGKISRQFSFKFNLNLPHMSRTSINHHHNLRSDQSSPTSFNSSCCRTFHTHQNHNCICYFFFELGNFIITNHLSLSFSYKHSSYHLVKIFPIKKKQWET